jgi:SAM-dependent methyltransferase
MPEADPEHLDRVRQEADRQYNEALTAFDAALSAAALFTAAAPHVAPAPPEWPHGWRNAWLRVVRRWLMPWVERRQEFETATADALDRLIARERERTAAFERFQSALILFLQRITAFVESKDRHLAASLMRRFDEHQHLLAALPDLQSRVAVLQRTSQMLVRQLDEVAAGRPSSQRTAENSDRSNAGGNLPVDDCKYVGFEDQFRGSDDSVSAKLQDYIPLFAGSRDVVDIGCGRGEFLAALQAAGVHARGIDTNGEMVAIARDRGLDATRADALGYFAALPAESIGGVIATQVVEHMEPSYLLRLLDVLSHVLRPGAPIVLETINPACWYAYFSSYIRDLTHVRPIHPETLQYLVRASGFERVEIRYRAPVPDRMKLQTVDVATDDVTTQQAWAAPLAAVAHKVNVNAAVLNSLIFTHLDYAVIAYRS